MCADRAVAGRRRAAEPRGWITTTARNRALDIGCAARRLATSVMQPRTGCTPDTISDDGDRTTGDSGPRSRRPAPPDLHVLPPGARAERAGGAHPATARRAADRRDRACLPRARGDDGAAPRAGQAEDRRRQHPVPRARGLPSCPSGSAVGARGDLPRVQRGLHRERRRCARSGTTSATRRSGSRGCSRQLMPDEPEVARPAGAAAAHRGAPRRRVSTSDGDAGAARRPGPHAVGPRARSTRGTRSCGSACAATGPGRYQFQAAIAAVHADARPPTTTDWGQIVQLYDQLSRSHRRRWCGSTGRSRSPSSTGRTRAFASSLRSTARGLDHYAPFHAARADLLRRCRPRRRCVGVVRAGDRAVSADPAQRRFLERRRLRAALAAEQRRDPWYQAHRYVRW